MDGRSGPLFSQQEASPSSGKQNLMDLPPWRGLSAEPGMPGRLQEGQLLHSDDEPEEETDSDRERRSDAIDMAGSAQHVVTQPHLQQSNSAQAALKQEAPREDESGTDTDEDGQLIRAKAKAAQEKSKPAIKRRPTGKTRAGAGITLGLLIREGILWPGTDVLSVEYKSVMTHATLTPDGQIICKINGSDTTFESPSAFSIFLKRMVNPARKADDGWKTVKYNGKFLESYKLELAKRRLAAAGDEDENTDAAPAAKKPKLDPGASSQGQPLVKARPNKKAENGHAGSRFTQGIAAMHVGSNLEDENQMIPCERYRGEPGGAFSGSQPFRVTVTSGAALLMDFHSHLSTNEVVGLLAGSWQSDARVLRVERAFAVHERRHKGDIPAAEMDEQDEAHVRGSIAKQHGLRCVGWYHSHPHAATHPSTSDILFQITQQKQHRIADSSDEPFIGAIVGPHQSAQDARIAYFRVDYPEDQDFPSGTDPIATGCLPMQVEVEEDASAATEQYIASMPQNEMRLIAQRCASSTRRADMLASAEEQPKRLDRLKQSIAARLPPTWPAKRVQDYLVKTVAVVTAAWKFYGKNEARAPKAEEDELEISDVTQSEHDQSTEDAALADDATGSTPAQVTNGHAPVKHLSPPAYKSEYGQPSPQLREEYDEPVASSFFHNGAAYAPGNFEDGYDDGFLGPNIQGSPS